MTAPYAGAYWPARAESLEACTSRLERFLDGLATADPLLATWYEAGHRSRPLRPLDTTRPGLEKLLQAGRNRNDSDRAVIDELGFSVAAWNGDHDAGARWRVHCGASDALVGNSVVINLPSLSDRSATLYGESTATKVMVALVEAWEPDWATFTSHELREAQGARGRLPVLGWLTYLSGGRGDVPELDGPYRVEHVSGGALITVDGDALSEAGPVLRLGELLGPDLLAPAGPG